MYRYTVGCLQAAPENISSAHLDRLCIKQSFMSGLSEKRRVLTPLRDTFSLEWSDVSSLGSVTSRACRRVIYFDGFFHGDSVIVSSPTVSRPPPPNAHRLKRRTKGK